MTIKAIRDADSGTQWPIDVETEDEDSTQWVLRYGTPERIHVLSAASILSAYAALLDPSLPQRDAIEKLKRARRCSRTAANAHHFSTERSH